MNIQLVKLFDIYAPLLSERQIDIMNLYYNEDESLAEIAENTGITRQGVRDWIKKTEAQLLQYESAMKLAEKSDALQKQLEKLCASLDSGELERAKALLSEIKTNY